MGARLRIGARWFGKPEPQPIHDPLIPIRYLQSDDDAGRKALTDAIAKTIDREAAFRERRREELQRTVRFITGTETEDDRKPRGLADWQQ